MRGTSAIHRISAFWGLAALAPVAVLLFQDELSLLEAGVRALGILVGVLCLRWLTDRVVRGLASTLDRGGGESEIPSEAATVSPRVTASAEEAV